MLTVTDDLPWPELGNVSRGATRGNQGQKGVLSPPGEDGRCVLQLRVQPGVLAVQLNSQTSEWYGILDGEVNRALKLTKTYWRKARRRQDYDARADQNHMELHEWLQQLKDKTMSHLELLMQKGDIRGPPYIMPDDIQLSFLRKFIERHTAGIPHNPRLRKGGAGNPHHPIFRNGSVGSFSPEPESSYLMPSQELLTDSTHSGLPRDSASPPMADPNSVQDIYSSRQLINSTRTKLSRAQKDTQEAFLRYTSCLQVERQARQEVAAAENYCDGLMQHMNSRSQTFGEAPSRRSPVSEGLSPRYSTESFNSPLQALRHPSDTFRLSSGRVTEWETSEGTHSYPPGITHFEAVAPEDGIPNGLRKHPRSWNRGVQDSQETREDISEFPPRKRAHQMLGSFDVFQV